MTGINDPHVALLEYRVYSDSSISYKDPPPIEFGALVGDFRLANGALTITLKEHFELIDDAKRAVEGILKAWEIQSDLLGTVGRLHFTFSSGQVIDRRPTPGEPKTTLLAASETIHVVDNCSVEQQCSAYPPPPVDFVPTPAVETVARRWLRHLKGNEPLPSAAYFILTVIESQFGGRNGATSALQIDRSVLSKLGELSSMRGDANSARKAIGQAAPLSSAEDQWIRSTIVQIILRLGRPNSAARLSMLSLADLPPL